MRRFFFTALMVVLAAFIPLSSMAELTPVSQPDEAESVYEEGFPLLNAAGFLDEGEFIQENPEEGIWRYCSPTLRVEVRRVTQESPKLLWFEAEIWTAGEERWYMATAEEGKHIAISHWPYEVAQRNGVVLGINNDYVSGRWPNKNSSVGIIIRDGKILWSQTRRTGGRKFPNLDTLALMPDGSLSVFNSDEKTAEEYINMGVDTVLSFGPWLIRDGQVNEWGISTFGKENAPRTAIGMIENGHYIALVVEGRNRQRSVGVPISFMAERLLALGCSVGFNLDGGETSCMVFMGKQLNEAGGANNAERKARRISELLSIGYSTQALKENVQK